jgi:epoxyqueuosine reductase
MALLAEQIRAQARTAGFDLVGITAAHRAPLADMLRAWLEHGMHGTMRYMEDPEGRRADPAVYLPWARSLVVVGLDYWTPHPLPTAPEKGAISRYAWGLDYHRIVRARLETLRAAITDLAPSGRTHAFVDTSPVLEKGVAEAAGIGWRGKHTNLLRRRHGSWFFLGGVLDARLCISYLTIEHRGPIGRELRPLIGNRIFGCDDCQDVCPWNRFAQRTQVEGFEPRAGNANPPLIELMGMTRSEWNRRFKKTPVRRSHYEGFLRNVAVALGNWGAPEAVPALVARLDDPSPLVRGHVAWALGRVPTVAARAALEHRQAAEMDAWVREEIAAALVESSAMPGPAAAVSG